MDPIEEMARKYDAIYHRLNWLENLIKIVMIAVCYVAPLSLIFALYGINWAAFAMIAVGVVLMIACGIFQHAIAEKRHKTINNECREYDKLTEKGDLT